nr:type II toxin-antitoxin system VapC family toxin [uncultured Shinella sp.]
MTVDTSMVAIFYGEPEAVSFTRLINESASSRVSAHQRAKIPPDGRLSL